MSDDAASILYPDHPRGEPSAAPAVDANQSAADAIYGAGAKKDAYVSPFDQPAEVKPAEAKPGEPQKPTEAKPAADPAQVKAAAEQLATDLQLDPANPLSAEVSTEFAALGLNAEQSQKLVALDIKNRESYWNKTWSDWRTEAEKLPPADIDGARQFVKSYGDAELNALLNDYKLGNHPALIRAFARATKGKTQ